MKPLFMWKKAQTSWLFRGNILTMQSIKQKIFTVLLLKEKGGAEIKRKRERKMILMVSLKSINYKDILYGEDIRLRVQSGWQCMERKEKKVSSLGHGGEQLWGLEPACEEARRLLSIWGQGFAF